METLKVASLFCGCGGTDVGLIGNFDFLGRHYDANGIEIVYANDIDDNACAIFEKNFGITPDNRDIRTVSSDELPEFDILTGGFPCQSFSIVAQNPPRLGIKDERGMLFFEMCRILRERQPKCFIAENVKGILTANKKAAFPLIIKEFEDSGYDVKYTVLNAAEYGVPQKRERVIIVGFRKDLHIDFSFPEPIINDEENYEPLQSVIEDDVTEKYYFSEKAVAGMMRNREGMNKGRAQDVTKPCNTVGAHLAKVSLNSTDPVLLVDGRYRRFTPREVARIQSFPEDFQLIGTESAQYRALGNAIPPVMFWHVAKKVSDILKFHATLYSQTTKRVAKTAKDATRFSSIESLTSEIKNILKNISEIKDTTQRNDEQRVEISFLENPLNPNLLAYCFDVILGFDVRYRIFEKVNYIIDFDYKGTFATVGHFKMSYRLSIESRYRDEIIATLGAVRPLLEQLFMLLGEDALNNNEFSMENEARSYFSKLNFYEKRIENLVHRKEIIEEKCHGKYDIIEDNGKCKYMRMKGSDYLRVLESEIIYDIEAYIDTFFSALEHVLTLLYPFISTFSLKKSYYKSYIRNTKWHWEAKIRDVCGCSIPSELTEELRLIKEIYRNHNAHGGFSREMMAYVQIPRFGRFPMYVGKEYLKGFIEGCSDSISYEMFLDAQKVFSEFWHVLDTTYEIPMMFIRSGLPISVDTKRYTENVNNAEQAEWLIGKMWFDIDNQSNMDW